MALLLILQALWLIFPAYVANASPVVIHGKKPLDFGKKLGKYRILGNGKTMEGTVGGIAFGVLIGVLQIYALDFLPLGLPEHSIQLIIALSTGAIIGDIIGAFIKRRLGIPRGEPALLLDQLDFLIMALIFASFVTSISMEMTITLIIITPVLHLATNTIAYLMKMKKMPW